MTMMTTIVKKQKKLIHWLKQLYTASDVVFELKPGKQYWPTDMYEPLLIGIAFPFIRSKPWQLRGTPKMYDMARQVRSMSADANLDKGDLLRKFCRAMWSLDSLPSDVVSRLLYFQSKT